MSGYKGIKRYWALLPFIVFLGTYLITSIVIRDFYKVPIAVSVLLASVVAIIMNHNVETNKKLDTYAQGAGNQTIVIMCIIFILAGVFGSVAQATGAVSSTVNFALTVMPEQLLVPGIFIIACFISLAIGTSMGTIAALGPIAVGVASHTEFPVALVLGAVLSGAMFGDSLSFISDTTIAATRTQGCEMKDKFKMNFLIVLPAAILTFAAFYFLSGYYDSHHVVEHEPYQLYKIIPYLVVIIISLCGINVFITLITGIILTIIIGFIGNSFDVWQLLDVIQKGINSMTDLILISAMLGGIVEVIKYNGGISQVMGILRTNIKTKRGAELGIGLLVSLVDICTANNTVAIIVTGPLAKDIARKYGVSPQRSASLIDIFSCVMQGIIPYGAQILLCVSFVGLSVLSPISVMKYSYFPYLAGVFVILAILFKWPGDNPWEWLKINKKKMR